MIFKTKYSDILDHLDGFDPSSYAYTRNFIDGNVSKLSPYISRGVISTRLVYDTLVAKGYELEKIEKFIQELAWRDFWQQIWKYKKDLINEDLKSVQEKAYYKGIPKTVEIGKTGIEGIDSGIKDLYETGYLHNHQRMYLASLVCNIGHYHWNQPAHWMYYHLLDGDWASNALSWQWVAGSNSNKKYFANQENINKYCNSTQRDTILDKSYEDLTTMETPASFLDFNTLELSTNLGKSNITSLDSSLPTYIYNWYNLDPLWSKDIECNRVLLLEPSTFKRFPISSKCIQFMLDLSLNIENIQIFVGEFSELKMTYGLEEIYFKDHPLNGNYDGNKIKPTYLAEQDKLYLSFFKYWKAVKKELLQE